MDTSVEKLTLPNQVEATTSCTFRLVLNCTSNNTTEEKLLCFDTHPQTVLDVKKTIETEFNIPVCVQCIKFESTVLGSSDKITSLRIRSGDSLSVTYNARAQCSEINDAVDWMTTLCGLLRNEVKPVTSDEAYSLIVHGYQTSTMEDLAYNNFSPWTSPVTQVNKLYFLQIGGLDVLLELYSHVLRHPWSMIPVELKYVEYSCMTVISNLASSLEF